MAAVLQRLRHHPGAVQCAGDLHREDRAAEQHGPAVQLKEYVSGVAHLQLRYFTLLIFTEHLDCIHNAHLPRLPEELAEQMYMPGAYQQQHPLVRLLKQRRGILLDAQVTVVPVLTHPART